MPSEDTSILVNFGRPLPLFPLDITALLPQQVLPMHIFEPRYRQMIEHALDRSGQIAVGVFEGQAWKTQYHGRPPVRPYVCIGQIMQHEKLHDGRYNLLVQGICRARIIKERPPSKDRLYREVYLEPVGSEASLVDGLGEVRSKIESMLTGTPLKQLTAADVILEYLRNEEIPTHALLELITFSIVSEPRVRYALLSEGDIERRAKIIVGEMDYLVTLIRRAVRQRMSDLPKGCHWN